MSSKSLLDPELAPLLDAWPTVTLNAETLPAIRKSRAELAASARPLPDTVTLETRHVPGPCGAPDVAVRLIRPVNAARNAPAILHLHGGGYVLDSSDPTHAQSVAWATQFGATVASVDYRLAPETPAPGAVEDGYAALAWLHREAGTLQIDTSRIAVAGESAGGGLAAALALLVRDRAEFSFCHQQLIFPMLDDRTAVRTDLSTVYGEFIWTPASNHFGWSALLGHAPGLDGVSPYAAPARAEDLAGLPPAFLATGALDLFTEENLDYARRLMAAGVATELHVYPGAPHAFMAWGEAGVSRRYARDALSAMARGLGV